MEFTPIFTPDLYMSMSIFFVAVVSFRLAVHSLIRVRRARVTLRPVRHVESVQGRQLPMGTASEHSTTR